MSCLDVLVRIQLLLIAFFSVQNGILISFARMQNVSYDPAKDTITLQPGVRWEDAIAAVESHGVAPLGGRLG